MVAATTAPIYMNIVAVDIGFGLRLFAALVSRSISLHGVENRRRVEPIPSHLVLCDLLYRSHTRGLPP